MLGLSALLALSLGFLARAAAWAMIVMGLLCAAMQVLVPIAVAVLLAGLAALLLGKLLEQAGRVLAAWQNALERNRAAATEARPQAVIYNFAAARARKRQEA